jgi:hypothetical protein
MGIQFGQLEPTAPVLNNKNQTKTVSDFLPGSKLEPDKI